MTDVLFYVKCTDNDNGVNHLIKKGKTYPVYYEDISFYYIEEKIDSGCGWNKNRFEKITNGDIFNVGDIVTVRKDLTGNQNYMGVFFSERMREFCGKKYKIRNKDTFNGFFSYDLGLRYKSKVTIADYHWSFSPDMFEEYIHPNLEKEKEKENEKKTFKVKCIDTYPYIGMPTNLTLNKLYTVMEITQMGDYRILNDNANLVNYETFRFEKEKENEMYTDNSGQQFEDDISSVPEKKYGFVKMITKTELELPENVNISTGTEMAVYISKKNFISMIKLLCEGMPNNKVEAIKLCRYVFKLSLIQAKQTVEYICENM